jgi:hypothetical protein
LVRRIAQSSADIVELAVPRGATLILSAEELYCLTGRIDDWNELTDPNYWQRRIEYLRKVRAILRNYDEIVVHLCFRRQDEFAASLYAAKAMSGRFVGSFDDFKSVSKPLFDYGRQVDSFRTVFADVRVASFDSLRQNLIPAFCEWIGIPEIWEGNGRRSNVTVDPRLVRWACENRTESGSVQKLRRKFAQTEEARGTLPDAGSASFWSSDQERLSFLAQYDRNSELNFLNGSDRDAKYSFITVDERDSINDLLEVEFERWRLRKCSSVSGREHKRGLTGRLVSIVRHASVLWSQCRQFNPFVLRRRADKSAEGPPRI